MLKIDVGLKHDIGTLETLGAVTNVVQEPSIDLSVSAKILPALTDVLELTTELKEPVESSLQVMGNPRDLNVHLTSNVGEYRDYIVSESRKRMVIGISTL